MGHPPGNPASKADRNGHDWPTLALAGGGTLSTLAETAPAWASNPVGWAIAGGAVIAGGGYLLYRHYHNKGQPKAASTSPQSTPNVPPPPPPPAPLKQPDKQKGSQPRNKTHQTYTKTNPKTGEVYSGRTSGTGTPEENVAARDAGHHMNEQGYGPAEVDKSSTNANSIRGREQQLIDQNGGAQSQGGTSGNAINGVSDTNPKADVYKGAAEKEFGKNPK